MNPVPCNYIEAQAATIIQRQFRNKRFHREVNYRVGQRLVREAKDEVTLLKGFTYLFLAAKQKHPSALIQLSDPDNKSPRINFAVHQHLQQLDDQQIFEMNAITYQYLKKDARIESPEAKVKFANRGRNNRVAQLYEAIHYFSGSPSIYDRDDEAFITLGTADTIPGCPASVKGQVRTIIQNNFSRLEHILRSASSSSKDQDGFVHVKLYLKYGGAKLNPLTVYEYLNSHHVYDFNMRELRENILQLALSPQLNDSQKRSIKLYFAYSQWEKPDARNKFSKSEREELTNEQLAAIFSEARGDQNLSVKQRCAANFALAMMCHKKESNLLTLEEVARIFKNSCSLPQDVRNPTNSTWEFRYLSFECDAKLGLATLRAQKQTDLIDDEEMSAILSDLNAISSHSYREEVAKLYEKLYLEKRILSYQKLVIANHTGKPLHYYLTLNKEPVVFVLQRSERKTFEDLRNRGISHATLKVQNATGGIMATLSRVDINSYVSCYGMYEFKCEVYYELDASEEAREPTSNMVRIVAALLAKDKDNYPDMNSEDYIKSLGCDVGHGRYNQFTRELNSLMRPEQLKKAIQKIVEGDL